jgi:micrococcal nuclease
VITRPWNRRVIFSLVLIVGGLLLSSGVWAERSTHTLPAEVQSITDGVTIRVRINGREEKVRLIGIDAPESHPNPKAQKDSLRTGDDMATITEMGQRATRYVKSIVRPGDWVQIELDIQERDRYGRLLAYVWLQDGRFLNEEIVGAGYAGLMTIPPNVKYHQRLTEAHREAQEARRGLYKPNGGAQ